MGADFFAGFILFFSSDTFLISLIILGLYNLNRDYFLKASILLFITMVINAYLKQIFQIPLNPEMFKTGWAYPSGHTSSVMVLWGALAMQYRKPIMYYLIGLYLILMFNSMVYVGYHDWVDIFGGVCLASIILILSRYVTHKRSIVSILSLGIITQLSAFIILLALFSENISKYPWLWLTQGITTGIIITAYFFKGLSKLDFRNEIAFLNTILAIAGIFGINHLLSQNDVIYSYFKGLCSGLWILVVVPTTTHYFVKRFKR